jgi:hypothetical protein
VRSDNGVAPSVTSTRSPPSINQSKSCATMHSGAPTARAMYQGGAPGVSRCARGPLGPGDSYVAASPRRPTRSHRRKETAPWMSVVILSLRCGPYVQGVKCQADGGVESDGSESGIRQGVLLGSGLCDEAEQHEVPASGMADLQVGPES